VKKYHFYSITISCRLKSAT